MEAQVEKVISLPRAHPSNRSQINESPDTPPHLQISRFLHFPSSTAFPFPIQITSHTALASAVDIPIHMSHQAEEPRALVECSSQTLSRTREPHFFSHSIFLQSITP